MSIRYFGESVSILKERVSPRLTLMSVANPWIVESPELLISHSVRAFPGLQFSATILLAGEAQGPGFGVACADPAGRACAASIAIPPMDRRRVNVFIHGPFAQNDTLNAS